MVGNVAPGIGAGPIVGTVPTRPLRLTAAVVLLVLGMTGCGGADPPSAAPSASPSGTASAPPSASPSGTASAPLSASPSPGASSGNGRLLSGEGYSFALPVGWQEATEQFREYTELIDAGAVNAAQGGQPFSDNVNVLRNADQAELPPAQAEGQFTDELRTVATRVQVRPAVTVGGVDALHLTGRTEAGEVTALTDQYIAYVDGAYYVVTFSYGAGTPGAQRRAEVASMLDSWAWG
jgi:hypothetical protein